MKTIITLGLITLWTAVGQAQSIQVQQDQPITSQLNQWTLSSSEGGELALQVDNPNASPLHIEVHNMQGETIVAQDIQQHAVVAFDTEPHATYQVKVRSSACVRVEVNAQSYLP